MSKEEKLVQGKSYREVADTHRQLRDEYRQQACRCTDPFSAANYRERVQKLEIRTLTLVLLVIFNSLHF